MTLVAFVRTGRAYQPEIFALAEFCERRGGYGSVIVDSMEEAKAHAADVVWTAPGLALEELPMPVIHDYSSSSTPPFPRVKNLIKRSLNVKPAGRSYLNPFVREAFAFRDDVPFILRDMGVADGFFEQADRRDQPSVDFVYSGTISRSRGVHHVLECFSTVMSDHSLMLVGDDPERMRERFTARNIHFHGPVEYSEIPSLVGEARHGLSVAPTRYPYTYQTSTKTLEYLAAGLGVVSTKTEWARKFAQEHEGSMLFVDDDCSDLSPSRVASTEFRSANLDMCRWDSVLSRAGVTEFLLRVLNSPQVG